MKRIVALLCAAILLLCVSSCGSKDKKVVLIPQNFNDFFKVESLVESSKDLRESEVEGSTIYYRYDRTTKVTYAITPLIPLQVDQNIKVTFSITSSDSPDHYKTLYSECMISENGKGSGAVSFFDQYKKVLTAGSWPWDDSTSFGDAVIEIESIDGYVLLDPEIYQSLQMKR